MNLRVLLATLVASTSVVVDVMEYGILREEFTGDAETVTELADKYLYEEVTIITIRDDVVYITLD